MTTQGRWGPSKPLPEIWKTPPGTHAEHAAEQDRAAGGREARIVQLSDGKTATASIALKHWPKSRRVYAYLRYWRNGKTIVKYVGDVTADERHRALEVAWRCAREAGLLSDET